MKLLLDTHTLLWFIGGDPLLSESARHQIEEMANDRLISVATLWELGIKASMGKLTIALPFPTFVEQHLYQNSMQLLQITAEHVEIVRQLPFHHKAPFDRLLIAQGLADNLTLLSRDGVFDAYGVQRLW